jgi:CHAT domain-containing protein
MADATPSEITFVVPGRSAASRGGATPADAGTSALPGRRKARVEVATQRDAGAPVRISARVDTDVVVLHVEGGPALVLHPLHARDLLLAQASDRPVARGAAPGAAGPDEVQVPGALQWRGLDQPATARGAGLVGKIALKAIDIVTDLFTGRDAAEWTALKLAARIDGNVVPGVYRLSPTQAAATRPGALPAAIAPPVGGRPVLVLLHGTFSSTAGTFGKLWAQHPARVAALFTHYAEQVYALDHATLAASPIDNALMLVQALPKGVPVALHLVTHSRGGLVAEVLARVAATTLTLQDLAAFAGDDMHHQRTQLQKLADALAERQVTVERVVRVACPARGTLLASRRLDAYLSVLQWSLQLAGVPVLPGLVDFLTAVARERTDPETLPGLAAMTPHNPLVQWLNDAREAIPGDLRVVAGDREGDTVGTWLKTLVADAFYWTDNDIVVQTSSMYGGTPRRDGAQYLLDQGGSTTHFAYFANARTAAAIVDALVQDAPAGFAPIGPLSWAGQSPTGSRAIARAAAPQPDKPAVFVLPGILGSHLKVKGQRVWLGWRVLGGLDRLAYAPGQDEVVDDGPIGTYYDDLMDFLRETHEVIGFGFDWRRPLEEEAHRLAAQVDAAVAARAGSGQPVRFLAHSMGGLLVRTLALECPDTWGRVIAHPGGRLLMLGTPNAGSWAPMQVLSGDDNLGNTLAALGAPFRDHAARTLMAQFPGFLQLQAGLLDPALKLADPQEWQRLADDDVARVRGASWWHRNAHTTEAGDTQVSAYAWGVPAKAVLQQAVALRQRLDAQCVTDLPRWADRLALVVGRAPFTPDGYTWADEGFVYLDAQDGGDGRVTLAQARLPGVGTWAVDAEHGALTQCRQAYGDYLRLLVDGQAQHLDRLPAMVARDGAQAAPAAVVRVRSRPSRGHLALARPADSALAVLGAKPGAGMAAGTTGLAGAAGAAGGVGGVGGDASGPPLRVTVVNGNLAFVRQPLLVGHYTSSQLSGAALAVNGMVGGVLADALEVGRYPQQAGVAQVFRNTAAPQHDALLPQPESVVVIGLGPEGGLNEALLAESVCQGVLAWTERLAEGRATRNTPLLPGASAPGEGIALAAVLMGSGGIGFQPGNAARAIALGVRAANSRIVRLNDLRKREVWPHVAHLRLVELYLERAAEAWRGLQVHAIARPGELLITPTIEAGEASLRRQVDSAYRGTKHDFISITSIGQDGQPLARGAVPGSPAPKATAIQFRLDTKRARTEVRAVRAQSQLLQEMLQHASNAHDGGTQIGRTLFQLLVPLEIEPFLAGRTQMLLEVDQGTAVVPWELLDTAPEQGASGESVPWGVRSRLIRKLVTSSYRDAVRDASRQADVLVIGEPLCKPEYGRLAGALREAQQVAKLMRGSARVGAEHTVELLRADATAVINALMDRPYRMLHVAAHGEQGGAGGVVLSGGTFLGPSEIGQMRAVPELVFVNCCHLAKVPDELLGQQPDPFNRSAFAASTAEALIAIGVRCVVAAGWAVDDDPAERFAQVFYTQLLQGASFIDAVGQAREETWRQYPDSNTWAAYQCYGDPDWRLHGTDRRTVRPALTDSELKALYNGISSAQGLLIALEKLTVDARFEHVDRHEQHRQLVHLTERFGPVWGHQGAVAEAIGTAFIANGFNDPGIAWYERAVAANDGGASLRAAEQLSNQYARRAWKRVEALKADAAGNGPVPAEARATLATARTDIAQARDDLGALVRMQPSIERHSLIGSACKRLAMLERRAAELEGAWAGVATDAAAQALARKQQGLAVAAERRALAAMAHAYGQSEQLARAQGDARLYYPASNGLAARLVGLRRPEDCAGFVASLAPVRAEVEAQIADGADFWKVACRIELDLYQALALGRLAQDLDAIDALVTDLQRRVPARNNWETLLDQARFVLHRWVEKRWVAKGEKQAAQAYEACMQARATGIAQGGAR